MCGDCHSQAEYTNVVSLCQQTCKPIQNCPLFFPQSKLLTFWCLKKSVGQIPPPAVVGSVPCCFLIGHCQYQTHTSPTINLETRVEIRGTLRMMGLNNWQVFARADELSGRAGLGAKNFKNSSVCRILKNQECCSGLSFGSGWESPWISMLLRIFGSGWGIRTRIRALVGFRLARIA